MAVRVSSACIGCQACIPACPYEALYINEEGLCQVIEEKCVACGQCVEVCPVSALSLPEMAHEAKEDLTTLAGAEAAVLSGDLGRYQGVWVFIEQREGQIMPVSLELLGAGRQLAQKLGVELAGVLLGHQVCGLANKVYECGADKVYLVDNPALRYYRTETYMQVFVDLAKEYLPEIILMGATTTGRDLAGAVATELRTGLTADCTGLDIDLQQRLLLATRPAFGGNIMATIVSKAHRPQMATVRPKVMRMPALAPGRQGALVQKEVSLKEEDLLTRVLEIVQEQGEQVNLQEAEIIVAGGRGLGDRDGFQKICFGLAEALGGRVGASRAAVEAGWIDHKYQVGQTGVTVAPKIYFALGISGAIQHLVGIRGADVIIAINTDPNAPIFKECTYGLVGDVFKLVPLLTEPLKELLTQNKADLQKQLQGQGGINCA
ncbi:electron transfer flavoprotein subunit alpha [Desulforamulus ruminis]|uniref:Electron transfer flavoprotein alpha/beta-subunit n=1 Tax=Desulforamulus ruminis (strain ATCC 23193 / DSM 2154 / NCIMB 8452 / DL) TaxID=696281 RepID=F6DLT5_DESRL|nr:electron transfer flavoprotein subunit alpha [Desulforamulus ruminis]AEG58378.1 Electron transfer flavoprotein alpha/beta-subunit [Desulforamulus ruminis DSM 2154]